MNRALADILSTKLDSAYIDRKAGIVFTFEKVTVPESGPKVIKRIPVAYLNGEKVDMIPDSRCKCMIYFEDQGISAPSKVGPGWQYISRLRLVCWLNSRLISGQSDSTLKAKIMTDVIDKLAGGAYFSQSPYTRVLPKVVNIPTQDKNIFAKYDYSEQDQQYLMQPYDYFAVDFQIPFTIPTACLNSITVTNPEACTQ
ncbi:MAG: hypothetical protein GXC72_00850 [Chitinophagaceae bacterium]|jgi:hypothetical protein|nr:hypothetical protein [Chitinophagaceae bacterium]